MSLAADTALPLAAERPEDAPEVERLVLAAFGPGRFAKAAERLREGRRPLFDLSFIAWDRGQAVGCVRLWPIRIGQTPALLLGPIAVDADWRSRGLGAALIEQACQAAAEADHGVVLLVGDEPYYGPLGFAAGRCGSVAMPGPVDQRRVLVRALRAGADQGLEGLVSAA
jgi:predicted N-acetyltransferase YhbS